MNWKTDKEDRQIILAIAHRAVRMFGLDPLTVAMDITACHLNNDFELDLEDLLGAEDFDFTHDIIGISKNINRGNGKIEGLFVPRFAKSKEAVGEAG